MVCRPAFWNPPGPGAGPGAAEKGEVGPGGFDLRTLRKAPLSAGGLSERTPLSNPPLKPVPPPAAWGRRPPSGPWWGQSGPGRNFPVGLSLSPHTLPPPKILGSMFTFSFECQQRGCLLEAPVWAGGAGRVLYSPALTFTPGGEAPPRAGGSPSPATTGV